MHSVLIQADPPFSKVPIRAAQYVRMSTEHQQYSTENQKDALRAYAEQRGIEIVKTYADEGRSGLRLENRPALGQLIRDVHAGDPGFSLILINDVSRWGRFQDTDESAFYEYLCRRAGIRVEYCAEQFENDGSPVSAIVKNIKRVMAAEYSRELSDKVHRGQRRIAEMGFRLGGEPGYGLRRLLIDRQGNPRCVLKVGERKSVQTDRVVLVPGPAEEIETVRWIFETFLSGAGQVALARMLNARGFKTHRGRQWTRRTIVCILTNPKYVGDLVWNRTSQKLKRPVSRNDPEQWVVSGRAFDPIVSRDVFDAVQKRFKTRNCPYRDEVMLEGLRRLLSERGYLSRELIAADERLPWPHSYIRHFGSIIEAYRRVGFEAKDKMTSMSLLWYMRRTHKALIDRVIALIRRRAGSVEIHKETGLLTIGGELTAALVFARQKETEGGVPKWTVNLKRSIDPDVTVVLRTDESCDRLVDCFVFPRGAVSWNTMTLRERNDVEIDSFQFTSIRPIIRMVRRASILEVGR